MGFLFFLLIFALALYWYKFKRNYIGERHLQHVSGIPGLDEGKDAFIRVYRNKITFDDIQTIPMSRIKGVELFTEEHLVEKNKSVIGRAIVGGLILGPLGAVVGSISGVGKKEKMETKYFLSIQFSNKEGEDAVAVFWVEHYVPYADQIDEYIKFINKEVKYTPQLSIEKIESFEI